MRLISVKGYLKSFSSNVKALHSLIEAKPSKIIQIFKFRTPTILYNASPYYCPSKSIKHSPRTNQN